MKNLLFFLILLLGYANDLHGQDTFSNDPWNAQFITEDVDRFWKAFDEMDHKGEEAFQTYMKNGSKGVKGFTEYRIISAEELYKTVKERKHDYLSTKGVLNNLETKQKRIRAIYTSMKYWYPDTKFPPIYFVVGRFNSGGTVSDDGIILGAEMLKNLDGLPALVAHELIHFQQKFEGQHNLLFGAINEGSADFIGELISGEPINTAAYQYGEQHLEDLRTEFVLLMDQDTTRDWLYETSGKDSRPNDLGYWMGYKITEAYFNQKQDKHKAIYEILNMKDAHQFLKESGFLDSYIEKVSNMTEKEKTMFIKTHSDESYNITIKVIVPDANDEVYITGNRVELANWDPKKVLMKKTSEMEREITLNVPVPINFKFTRGSWETEALVEGVDGLPNLNVNAQKSGQYEYTITTWKDKAN